MQSREIGAYIYHGMRHRYLQHAREGFPIKPEEGIGVLLTVTLLLSELEKYDLHVTRRAAETALKDIRTELEAADVGSRLSAKQAGTLSTAMQVIDQTLRAEVAGHVAFIVTDKRYDVQRLLHDMEPLFSAHVFASLPSVARFDFQEAGRCIAFELPTAAAFHLMRGTEDVLKALYCNKVKLKSKRVDLMWGPMLNDLKKHKKPLPPELMHELDGLRQHFRNPTQHPEKIYNMDDAQSLLERSIDVVNQMMKLIG